MKKFRFNSTLVRLKPHCEGLARKSKIGFNSTLVRLKQDMKIKISPENGFQFHSGSIKTVRAKLTDEQLSGFNSTLVRLKRCYSPDDICDITRFNSTLVRLKRRPGFFVFS